MSAQMLRDNMRSAIHHQISEHMTALKGESQAPMDRLRYLQGIIQGLEIAEAEMTAPTLFDVAEFETKGRITVGA
jgi:hypothetical protein